jgi:hypothetical protein
MIVVTFGLIALMRRKAVYILSSTAHSGPLCVGPLDAQLVYHFSIVTMLNLLRACSSASVNSRVLGAPAEDTKHSHELCVEHLEQSSAAAPAAERSAAAAAAAAAAPFPRCLSLCFLCRTVIGHW